MLEYCHIEGYWRIRILNRMVLVFNRTIYPPPFSVRNGYVKEYRLGKYGVQFLKVFKYE